MVPFSFASVEMCALSEGGLFHPASRSLLLADLHLEKASSYARRGQMLPPYDSIETLRRVAALVERTGAAALFCLGDSFHDRGGAARLPDEALGLLGLLTAKLCWTWIVGNHDREEDPRQIAAAGGVMLPGLEGIGRDAHILTPHQTWLAVNQRVVPEHHRLMRRRFGVALLDRDAVLVHHLGLAGGRIERGHAVERRTTAALTIGQE